MVGSSSSLMNNINANRVSFNRASINNLRVNNLTLKDNNETSIINNFNKKNDDLYQASIGLPPKENSLVSGEIILNNKEKIPINNSYNVSFYLKLQSAVSQERQGQTRISSKLGQNLINTVAYDVYSENPKIINSKYSYDNFIKYFDYTFLSYDSSTQTFYGTRMKVHIGEYILICYINFMDENVYLYNIQPLLLEDHTTNDEFVKKLILYLNANPAEKAEFSFYTSYLPNDDDVSTYFLPFVPIAWGIFGTAAFLAAT